MAKQFLTPIDMTGLEIRNHRLDQSVPGSPVEGQIWYSTANHRPQWRSNSTTVEIYPSATASTANTEVLRDGSGNFSANVITAATVTGLSAPSAASDAANKAYVDSVAAGLDPKASCRVATTANLSATRSSNTLTETGNGALSIDGVSPIAGDRILVKNQTTGADNGIYVVTNAGSAGTPYVLDRATDFDGSPSTEVSPGAFTFVEEGTTNATTGWVVSTPNPITLNTTTITWVQYSQAGVVTGANVGAGTGQIFRDKTGTSLNFKTIAAGSTKLSVANNANDVTLDVVEANLSLNNIGGTLNVNKGGTGAATFTTNGVLLGNGTSAISATTAGTADQVFRIPGGGGAPAFGAIALNQAAAVTGTLAIGNGGTGQTTANAAFNALSPLTTAGDLLVFTTVNARLAIGTTGQYLRVTGGTAVWTTIPNTDVTGLGTMSTQNASAVAITGGTIDGTVIGGTTRAAGSFTTVTLTTALAATSGGTGFNTTTTGDLLVGAAANTWSKTAIGATNNVLIVTGGVPTWGQVALNSGAAVTGTLGVNNGGTGQTTATAAFNALSPLTTQGDILTNDGTNDIRLAIGGNGTVLTSNGTSVSWVSPSVTSYSSLNAPVYRSVVAVSLSNTNIAAPGATIDGVTLVAGDRILLQNQTTSSQNGIWVWNGAASALTRPSDYAAGNTTQAYYGAQVQVNGGSISGGVLYYISTTGAITIDTTSVTFTLEAVNLNGVIKGTLGVVSGGTGLGATTVGGILVGSSTTAFTNLPIGTTGQYLRVTGGTAVWTTIPNTDITGLGTMSTQNASAVAITGGTINGTSVGATTPSTGAFTTLTATTAIAATSGGTGTATTAVGDLLVGAASNTWAKLTIGATGTILRSTGTTAAWSTLSAAGIAQVFKSVITGDGTTTAFVVTHSIAQYVDVSIIETTTGLRVEADIACTNATQATITFAVAPANAKTYQIVVTG